LQIAERGALESGGKVKRNIAIVGTGYWGKNLVRVFGELGALRTVCDAMPGRFEGLGLAGDVRRCTDLDEVLSDPGVSAVVIATPAATHYDVARACLEADRDVFVEKPLALEVDQGQGLVDLAEARDRVLMVGHILRYHPAVLKLQEMITRGDMGRVEYVYSNRLNMGKLRTEENILWSFAPHDISVILALLDEQPVAVSSHGEAFLQRNVSDVTLTSIEFPNNTKAHTFVSWLHPFKEQRLVVVGSEQMAVFEDSSPSEKLVVYPHRVEWHAGKIPVAVKGERTVIDIPADEPLRVECQHFIESCSTRIPPRTDGHEGLAVLRVLAAAEKSLRAGGAVVSLPASGNGRRRATVSGRLVAQAVAAQIEARVGGTAEAPTAERHTSDARRPMSNGSSTTRTACVAERCAPSAAPRAAEAFVHPTAVVDPGCEIGAGTKIWHYTHISRGSHIGPGNVFGQNVFVADNVRTGSGCKVQNNVSLYKGVVLEDDVFCGPSCVFTNVIDPRAFIEKKSEFKPTLVKQGASIGANATVVCGNTLGRYCLVGSGAVVTHDVPDYALVTGMPARRQGWVCRCGARLSFRDGAAACPKCGNGYSLAGEAVRPVQET
jgi:UDP-2-acetamido-3-amino-2,3-dideoxy-glucuronate N-acetyltransferase